MSPRQPVLEAGLWGPGTAGGLRVPRPGGTGRWERWLWDRVQVSQGQERALAAGRGGIRTSGWDSPWRALGSGTEGPRLCRSCHGGVTSGVSPAGPAVRGLHLRAERGGTAVAPGPRTRSLTRRGELWVPGRAVTVARPDFVPSAGTVHPPGSCGCPWGCCSAGPAPRKRPRLGAWSWRCRAWGWWRRGAGSHRRDLRSEGQSRGCHSTGNTPTPRVPAVEGSEGPHPVTAATGTRGSRQPPHPHPVPRPHHPWQDVATPGVALTVPLCIRAISVGW